ncbi:hypothetical protein CC80DRAFT_545289 [Byssothecium circinans]|uniref:Uncharacterized protein n=1 Tax=Byssothecium circinans TaxID=147558 RepID=A0A6A5U4R1_9PLEO|nr:hypothetical protein CC80DRAFT_545289 [Byssothecium circinans]
MLSFEDLEAVCYTTQKRDRPRALDSGGLAGHQAKFKGTGERYLGTWSCSDEGTKRSLTNRRRPGSGVLASTRGVLLERECEDGVNMEASALLAEDQGQVEKNADEQGLVRGVQQSSLDGCHYWQMHAHAFWHTAGVPGKGRDHRQGVLQGSATLVAGCRCFS